MGIVYDRCGIRTQEILPFPYTYGHRGTFPCGYDPVGYSPFDDRNRIGAHNLTESHPHGFLQGAAIGILDVFDEVDEHLRIGTAAELIAVRLESVLQDTEILDDAVMDEG